MKGRLSCGTMKYYQRLLNWWRGPSNDNDEKEQNIMWRSVGVMPCEDGSTYVVQQMVGFENDVEKPYDAHRTIHIDAAQGGLRRVEDMGEEIPEKWAKPQEQWTNE